VDVVAGDLDPFSISGFSGASFWRMPETVNKNFDEIIEGCERRGIELVFPTRDSELLFWSENKNRFALAGIGVVVSSEIGLRVCLDKVHFSEWGLERGLPFIPSFLELPSSKGKRFVLKERFGSGSKSIQLDKSLGEIRKLTRSAIEPIFQPFIKGLEISIDAWFFETGILHGLVLRTRDVVRGGESKVTTTFRNLDLEAQASRILAMMGKELELQGPVIMQAILHEGKMAIIEVNARFGGASTASIQVGLDSLCWSILQWTDGPEAVPKFERSNFEIRQVRGPVDTHVTL
jgi:carbamoyl-phosphate synthase large subunit